jgi:hypothetical protein
MMSIALLKYFTFMPSAEIDKVKAAQHQLLSVF